MGTPSNITVIAPLAERIATQIKSGRVDLNKPTLEEFLYPAMEDYRVDVRIAEGPNAQTIPMSIEPFTLIGASTRFGMLTPPMRARFGLIERLGYYPTEDLQIIVTRSAGILDIGIDIAVAQAPPVAAPRCHSVPAVVASETTAAIPCLSNWFRATYASSG